MAIPACARASTAVCGHFAAETCSRIQCRAARRAARYLHIFPTHRRPPPCRRCVHGRRHACRHARHRHHARKTAATAAATAAPSSASSNGVHGRCRGSGSTIGWYDWRGAGTSGCGSGAEGGASGIASRGGSETSEAGGGRVAGMAARVQQTLALLGDGVPRQASALQGRARWGAVTPVPGGKNQGA